MTEITFGVYTRAIMKRILGLEMWYGYVIEVWPVIQDDGSEGKKENVVKKFSGYSERWVKGKADQYVARNYVPKE